MRWTTLAAILLLCVGSTLQARTWTYRSADGGKLRALIERVAAGDTIVVEGLVSEGTVHIDKPLVLLGGRDAVIDGGGEGHVLGITADDVTIRGLTIRGTRFSGMDDLAGIFVQECRRTVIANNFLDKCFFAIYLSGSKGAVVEGNTVLGEPGQEERMANGIHLWKCSDATIRHNRVEHHRDGIYFEFVTDSRIHHNTTKNNLRYGLHFMFSHRDIYEDNHFEDNGAGVAVMFSHTIEMHRNHFIANRGASAYGLLLKEINDGEITGNTFTDNTTGIMVDGCNRINVQDNVFRLNGWALRLFASAFECTFRGNTFSGNTFDVSTNGSLRDNVMEGNYWDRYTGYDLDRDGHGDVPHRPLGFFTLLVEQMPYAMVFSRSLFVSLLDRAERLVPSLSPESLKDDRPLMRPPGRKGQPVAMVNERSVPYSSFYMLHSLVSGERLSWHLLRPLRGRNPFDTSFSNFCDPSGVLQGVTRFRTPEGSQKLARRALNGARHFRPRRGRGSHADRKPSVAWPCSSTCWSSCSGRCRSFPRTTMTLRSTFFDHTGHWRNVERRIQNDQCRMAESYQAIDHPFIFPLASPQHAHG